jgi:ribosome-associated toxin RatA of RatAB toxin-antitoxin module
MTPPPGRAWLAIALCLSLAAAADEPAGEELDARIGQGEVVVEASRVEGYGQPALRTFAVIDAPPEAVFALVDDCAGYVGVMPRVATSAETAREGDTSTCSWVVDMPFPMGDLSTEVAVTRTLTPGRWRREFKQTRGDFLRNEGQWTLTPFRGDGARTRVDYRLFVAMDTVLPDAFVKRGQHGAMKDLLANLRARLVKPR